MPKLEDILDKGKRVKHSKLAELTEEVVTDPSKIQLKLKQARRYHVPYQLRNSDGYRLSVCI